MTNAGSALYVHDGRGMMMANQGKTPSLEIEVQDFGPIVHGKVDLRPMTVFIGPSNTGKSYLAILLYALHRFFSGGDSGAFGLPRFRAPFKRSQPDISPETVVALTELLRKAVADKLGRFEQRDLFLPDAVVALLRSQFDNLGDEAGSAIARYFGLNDAAALVRKGRSTQARLVLQHSLPNGEKDLTHTLLINARQTSTQFTIPEHLMLLHVYQSELASALQFTGAATSNFGLFGFWDAVNLLMKWLVRGMVDSLRLPAFYLPAGRTGVMHAHTAIVSAMLERATMAGLEPAARTPMLSGVLVDFLRQLIEINSQLPDPPLLWRLDGVRDIDVQIEQSIINGEILVSRSEVINYPRFTYRPNGWKADLPLLNASSMVSEIAPVVLYLRHIVMPGSVLIIEEPEAHLHPAMQVEFTRQLAKLAQDGYRVIITTHSEWVLEELGNVVQRSQLPEKDRAAVSESDAALPPEQVGVWLFRPQSRPRGSEIVEVKMGDAGLYDTGFDDVAIALSNDGANIFDRIRESR